MSIRFYIFLPCGYSEYLTVPNVSVKPAAAKKRGIPILVLRETRVSVAKEKSRHVMGVWRT